MCYLTEGAQDFLRHYDSLSDNGFSLHKCFICGNDFTQGKLLMGEDECCNDCYKEQGKVFDFYREITKGEITDYQLLTMKEVDL